MQISGVTNNNHNTTFRSKLAVKNLGHGTHYQNGLADCLYTAYREADRTFLRAIKALLKDGENDTYSYVICNTKNLQGTYFTITNPNQKLKQKYKMVSNDAQNNYMFRDLVVDIARQKGLIPGKPISTKTIVKTYQKVGDTFNPTEARNLLKTEGFETNIPYTDFDKNEKAIIHKEIHKEIMYRMNLSGDPFPYEHYNIDIYWPHIYKKMDRAAQHELLKMYDWFLSQPDNYIVTMKQNIK